MSLLDPADLTQMRSIASDEALPGTAVIQSQTYASDGGGAGSITWSASGTVDCRIGPISGAEREFGDRIASDADYVITLPHSATASTNHRILTGGGTYAIAAVRDRSWPLTLRIEVTKEV